MGKRIDIQLVVVLISVGFLILACQPSSNEAVQYPTNLGSFLQTGNYIIDPKTILLSLDKGETNVFGPMLATPAPDAPLFPPGSFPWKQTDYLKVGHALSLFEWKETLEGWSIYNLKFGRVCQDNPIGFDHAEITYYKTIEVNGEKVYTARAIEIYPLADEVSWGGGTDFPRPFWGGWNGIDLAQFKVTADDALRIAEENGGKEARTNIGNECRILIRAPRSNTDSSWDVYYYPGVYFEMLIDPYSGKYQIPTPSK